MQEKTLEREKVGLGNFEYPSFGHEIDDWSNLCTVRANRYGARTVMSVSHHYSTIAKAFTLDKQHFKTVKNFMIVMLK